MLGTARYQYGPLLPLPCLQAAYAARPPIPYPTGPALVQRAIRRYKLSAMFSKVHPHIAYVRLQGC